jgi:hypothetical protein
MNDRQPDRVVATVADGICDDIIEAIESSGARGTPSGHLYAALMGLLSFDQYQAIMRTVVATGRVELRGECYHAQIENVGARMIASVEAQH